MLKVTVNYVAHWDGFNIIFFEKQIMEYLITERQFKFVDACNYLVCACMDTWDGKADSCHHPVKNN